MDGHNYTLITGATGGLGNAFAYALAEQGKSLILTGRNVERLEKLQAELQEKFPNISIVTIAANLANEQDRYALMQTIEQMNARISMLVNVAGVDVQKAVSAYTQEKLILQCRVNLETAVSLCHFAIQNRADRLEIINISSVSGIYPMPYFALYSATKSALTSFSISLREEMKGKNVAVTAVLPGAIPTRDDIKEQIKGQGVWGQLAAKSPQYVVKTALKAVRKNKRTFIPGFWNKVMRASTAILPLGAKIKFIAKRWSQFEKDAF